MSFSKRLRELRDKRGLSQENLAKELNVPRSTVTNWENNDDRLPRPDRVNEIADFFGVTVDYLVGRADTNILTEKENNLLKDINKLTLEEIIEKYSPDLDGKPATTEEVKAAIAFIRSLRNL